LQTCGRRVGQSCGADVDVTLLKLQRLQPPLVKIVLHVPYRASSVRRRLCVWWRTAHVVRPGMKHHPTLNPQPTISPFQPPSLILSQLQIHRLIVAHTRLLCFDKYVGVHVRFQRSDENKAPLSDVSNSVGNRAPGKYRHLVCFGSLDLKHRTALYCKAAYVWFGASSSVATPLQRHSGAAKKAAPQENICIPAWATLWAFNPHILRLPLLPIPVPGMPVMQWVMMR